MGRKNKEYTKDLRQLAYEKLTSMQAFGESKKLAKDKDMYFDYIYSYNTYKTYWKHIKYFVRWIQDKHPECTTLKSARKYVNEWLQERVDQGLSAWTIQTEAKALGKLYDIRPDNPNYFKPPKRRREDIKRSRGDAVRDKHFSAKNNDEFIKFCRGVGGRRAAIGKLTGDDLWTRADMEEALRIKASGVGIILDDGDKSLISNIKDALATFPDQNYFVHFVKDKGGRSRFSPVIGPNKQQIVDRMMDTLPGRKVWEHVPTNADIHSYRGEYATMIYKMYSREVDKIPSDEKVKVGDKYKSSLYICRIDEAGKKLDRVAMLKCTKALGHNRENVVADNYLRSI